MTIQLSTIVEYTLGGIQLLFLIFLVFISDNYEKITYYKKIFLGTEFLISIVLLSVAYPLGIIIDNLAYIIFSRILPRPTQVHKSLHIKLLKKGNDYQIKRALGFESTKRIIRMTAINWFIFFLLLNIVKIIKFYLSELNVISCITFISCTILSIIICILLTYIYSRIEKYYSSYLKGCENN